MYYKLKKEEYLEYEQKFKQTYVGKQIFHARLIQTITGATLWGIAGFSIGYNSTENFQTSLNDFVFIFMGGLFLLVSVLWHIEYRRELKDYISKENK